jgi:hypothetical protein
MDESSVQLRDRLFNLILSGNEKGFYQLCKEKVQEIELHFNQWKRIPEGNIYHIR